MKIEVDVHILILPDTNRDWLKACLRSLDNEPVIVRLCPGIPGDTAAARTAAFREGNLQYVSFVDPDDEVVPGIFDQLLALCEEHPDCVGAYSDEMLMDEDGKDRVKGWSFDPNPYLAQGVDLSVHCVKGQYVHHVRLLKRVFVEKCLPLKTKRLPEAVLMQEISRYGPLLHLPEVGYRWRIHPGNTFKTYSDTEILEAQRIISEVAQ